MSNPAALPPSGSNELALRLAQTANDVRRVAPYLPDPEFATIIAGHMDDLARVIAVAGIPPLERDDPDTWSEP